MFKKLLENAFGGLSLITIGAVLSAFFSYCVSYGQLSLLDPTLLPAFSSADLATNFSVLLIPLVLAVVSVFINSQLLFIYILGESGIKGANRNRTAINITILLAGVFFFIALILSADDIYLLIFRIGVFIFGVLVALLFRSWKRGKPIDFGWKATPFANANLLVYSLVAFALLLTFYGKHETLSRAKGLTESTTFFVDSAKKVRKVVVLFASQERAVLFDGVTVFVVKSDDYDRLLSRPDIGNFDERTYWKRLTED